MKNIILGSGLIGLMAKELLAGDWQVIPFNRSRFFSFATPLADNYIVRDQLIDEPMAALGAEPAPYLYQRAYSVGGALIKNYDRGLCEAWLVKIFGDTPPSQSIPYWLNRATSQIYTARSSALYERLLKKYWPQLRAESAKGAVTTIGDHFLMRSDERLDFDNAISTIPLTAILNLLGAKSTFEMKSIHYVWLKSETIDLEGCNQTFVVDHNLDFYKVNCIAPNQYVFYSTREIERPGPYFAQILGPNIDILDGTCVPGALPAGEMPDLSPLEAKGLFCVGSCAQHDWCMDVSSCLLRLIRYGQRGYKPAKSRVIS